MFYFSLGFSQKTILRGKVTDKNTGEELIGATIFLKGTQTGTITDFDGNYSLETMPGKFELQCSFISYQTVNVPDFEIKTAFKSFL